MAPTLKINKPQLRKLRRDRRIRSKKSQLVKEMYFNILKMKGDLPTQRKKTLKLYETMKSQGMLLPSATSKERKRKLPRPMARGDKMRSTIVSLGLTRKNRELSSQDIKDILVDCCSLGGEFGYLHGREGQVVEIPKIVVDDKTDHVDVQLKVELIDAKSAAGINGSIEKEMRRLLDKRKLTVPRLDKRKLTVP